MSRAFEIVVTPTLFGLGGWLLDGWWGTSPIFTVVLAVWGVVGVFAKLWFGYNHEMRQHEEMLAANRRLPRTVRLQAPTASTAPTASVSGVSVGSEGSP